jgi:hypothetical protein
LIVTVPFVPNLRRGVNHAGGILMKAGTFDGNGAALSFRRGAENLNIGDRHLLGVNGGAPADRPLATGGRGVELRVRKVNLLSIHADRAAVSRNGFSRMVLS